MSPRESESDSGKMSDDDEIIEVRDIRDLRPRVKASLSGWGSHASFHSVRLDSNDRSVTGVFGCVCVCL